jgi:hypothetical protein
VSDRHPFKGWVKSWNGPSPTEAQTWAQDLDSVYIAASLKMKQVSELQAGACYRIFFFSMSGPRHLDLYWFGIFEKLRVEWGWRGREAPGAG